MSPTGTIRRRVRSVLLLGSGLAVLAPMLWAQEGDAGDGLLGRFDVGAGVRVDDDGVEATTDLGVALSSSTRAQELRFGADTQIRAGEDDEVFERISADLAYARASRSTALTFTGSYDESPIDSGISIFFDEFTGEELTVDSDGTRTTARGAVTLETGRDAPFQTETSASYLLRDFRDVDDPDLVGRETVRVSNELRFLVDPLLTLRTNVSYFESDSENDEDTDRETLRFTAGATYDISPVLTASANVGFTDTDTEETDAFGNRVSTSNDGASGDIALTLARPNGTVGLSYERDVTTAGDRDVVRLSRSLDLRQGASLDVSLGISNFEGDLGSLFAVAYARPTPNGRIQVTANRDFVVNSENEAQRNSRVRASYSAALTPESSYTVAASFDLVDEIDSPDPDTARASIEARYRRALTRDWDLSTRAEHRVIFEDGDRDESESVFTLSIDRSFTFRP